MFSVIVCRFFFAKRRRKEKAKKKKRRLRTRLGLCPIPRELLKKLDQNFYNGSFCYPFVLLSFAYFSFS